MQRGYGCHSRERKQQKGGKRIQERTMKQRMKRPIQPKVIFWPITVGCF